MRSSVGNFSVGSLRRTLMSVAGFVFMWSAGCRFTAQNDDEVSTPEGCDGLFERSSEALLHTHDVCVPAGDLTSMPQSATYMTSPAEDGHTHELVIDQNAFRTIQAGQTVVLHTNEVQQHSHAFSFETSTAVVFRHGELERHFGNP